MKSSGACPTRGFSVIPTDVEESLTLKTRNSERYLDSARHDKQPSAGYRLLLRDVLETGDVAHLSADNWFETLPSGGDRAEARIS